MLEHWYRALRSPSGIRLQVEGDRDRARAALYKARVDALDPDLKSLSVVFSPTDDTQIWIVHSPKATNGPA